MNQIEDSTFRQILTSNGCRLTEARRAVFDILNNSEPLYISEIIARAKGRVDRVSVYRNIALFEELGIANRINIGWKYKIELSDHFIGHHHHMSCLNCGVVIEIKDDSRVEEFIHNYC